MRVYFYTGSYTHSLYQRQAECPPAGVEYIASSPDLLSRSPLRRDFRQRRKWWYAPLARSRRRAAGLASRWGVINVRHLSRPDCDLIHSAQYLLRCRQDWVIDFEEASVFAWYSPRALARGRTQQQIQERLRHPSCRWILPWTEAARRSLHAAVDCSGFADKLRVVYPALQPRPWREPAPQPSAPVRILFVGTLFYEKGGWETLLACERVARHLSIHLTMVSYVPEAVRAQFRSRSFVSFASGLSASQLDALYRGADLFVLPVHTDTLGFVYLEAMSYGLACIGSRTFAVPEIIEHNQTGLTVEVGNSRYDQRGSPLYEPDTTAPGHPLLARLREPTGAAIEALAAAVAELALDPERRHAMGAAGWQRLAAGRFSHAERNRQLAAVYGLESSGAGIVTPATLPAARPD